MPHGTCDTERRSFLKLSGLLGLGTLGAALLPAERAEAVLFGRREYKVTNTRLAMGSFVSITAIHPSRDEAEHALGLAMEEIDRLSKLLSRHDPASPVSHLNRTGALEQAPPEVLEVVARSLYHHRRTNGAFDITVKPVLDLYQERFATGIKPTEAEILAVQPRVGSQHIRFAGGKIAFAREGMAVTLDGIAVGYIVDRVSELLERQGIANHLVNASGEISTRGHAKQGALWTVAIQDPAKRKEYPGVIRLGNGAISTSGNYEVYFDREKMFHHIVNPLTGHSPRQATSVTVKAATVMDADALSTGVFVMAPAEGVRYIGSQPGHECFVVQADGATLQSTGWSALS